MVGNQYLKCPNCEKIVFDRKLKLTNINEPCPCCSHKGGTRISWPNIATIKYFNIVYDQDFTTDDGKRVALIILCSGIELLLENVIWNLLDIYTDSNEISEFILDSNSGKERMRKVFNKFSNKSLGDILGSNNLNNFLSNWKDISNIRNKIIHGKYYTKLPDSHSIKKVASESLKAFSIVENEIIEQKKANQKIQVTPKSGAPD